MNKIITYRNELHKLTRNIYRKIILFFRQYQRYYRKQQTSRLRIIDIKKDNDNNTFLIVQLKNKNVVYRFLPKEIVSDDNLLNHFSKSDVKTITYLSCQPNQNKAKIITQEFNEKTNGMIFGIQRGKNNIIIKKTAREISYDKNLVRELTPEEALMVGYMLADEGFSKEKNDHEKT